MADTTAPVYASTAEPITAEVCAVCCVLVPDDLMDMHMERAHGEHREVAEQ